MSRCLINFGHLVRTRSIDFALGPAEEVNMSPEVFMFGLIWKSQDGM